MAALTGKWPAGGRWAVEQNAHVRAGDQHHTGVAGTWWRFAPETEMGQWVNVSLPVTR